MAFWWVNHKQTRDHEVRGGYLWSPMRNANGGFNQTCQNMTFVPPKPLTFLTMACSRSRMRTAMRETP